MTFGQVRLMVEAEVGGERVRVEMSVPPEVYDDSVARQAIEGNLRFKLAMEILRKWPPVVHVRRG